MTAITIDNQTPNQKTMTIHPVAIIKDSESINAIMVTYYDKTVFILNTPSIVAQYDKHYLVHCLVLAELQKQDTIEKMFYDSYINKKSILVIDKKTTEIEWEEYEQMFSKTDFYKEKHKPKILSIAS